MTQSFSMGTSNTNFGPFLSNLFDKGIDFASQIGVAAYNSHNAKRAAERQFDAQKELMALQYEYNKKAYEYQQTQGPTLYRQGLTSAGYNPILPFAGSGSGMSGSMHGVSGGSAALENPALIDSNAINNARMITANIRNVESQTQMNNSQTALTNEKVITEQNTQKLQELDKAEKEIYNAHLPSKLKSEIFKNINEAKAAIANAISNRISAGASVISAKAADKHSDFYGQDVLNNFEINSDRLSQELDVAIMNRQFDTVKGIVTAAVTIYGIKGAGKVIEPVIERYGSGAIRSAVGDKMFDSIIRGGY